MKKTVVAVAVSMLTVGLAAVVLALVYPLTVSPRGEYEMSEQIILAIQAVAGISAVALVIVTLTYARYTGGLAKKTGELAEATKDMAESTRAMASVSVRPKVVISRGMNEAEAYSLYVCNEGSGPAKHVRVTGPSPKEKLFLEEAELGTDERKAVLRDVQGAYHFFVVTWSDEFGKSIDLLGNTMMGKYIGSGGEIGRAMSSGWADPE